MATRTAELGLIKPGIKEKYSLDVFNNNLEILERELSKLRKALRPKNPGILVPLYFYPFDPATGKLHEKYTLLEQYAKSYPKVPTYVILNPSNGAGNVYDEWFNIAIKTLKNAGCYVLGYVSTAYTATLYNTVVADIDKWYSFYPDIDGIFFDEMTWSYYSDSSTEEERQTAITQMKYYNDLSKHARYKYGAFPVIGNPGTSATDLMFSTSGMDTIVVYENDRQDLAKPLDIEKLRGTASGYEHYAKYPMTAKAVLGYNETTIETWKWEDVAMHVGMIYTTQDMMSGEYKNPWDTLSQWIDNLYVICNARAI